MKIFSQSISLFLASLLVTGQLPAQVSNSLKIHLLDSDGSSAAAGSTTVKGFTVQIVDDAGNGVADAAVVFRLPDAPASGTFGDGSHAAVAYSDQNGRAQVMGIKWGAVAGFVAMKVTATKGTAHAGILVEETLTPLATAPAAATSAAAANTALAPAVTHEIDHPSAIATSEVSDTGSKPTPRPAISVRQPGTLDSSNQPSTVKAVAAAPSVTVTNGSTGEKIHRGSKTKWIILAAVIAAGAGAGVAMAGKSKSSTSSASTGVSIGGPTVSVGAP